MMRFMLTELPSKKYDVDAGAGMAAAGGARRAGDECGADAASQRRAASGRVQPDVPGDSLADDPLTIANPAPAMPLVATVTTRASPLQPLPAGGDGFEIERAYYTLDGEEADITQVKQNERYVVVLTVNENL